VTREPDDQKPNRDALKDRRRRQIIDATIAAIYRRGIGDARVADIARAAGVSYGIVSFYFKSKDALILATMNHVAREFSEALRNAVGDMSRSPMQRLIGAGEVSFAGSASAPAKAAVWIALWAQSHVVPSFRKRCCELQDEFVDVTEPLIREIVEEGKYETVDPRDAARTLCILLSGIDIERHLRNRSYSATQARRTYHSMLAMLFPTAYREVTMRDRPVRQRAAAAQSRPARRRRARRGAKKR